jgi:hypothetical protein
LELYKRLFDTLATDNFDYRRFYTHLGVEPEEHFSELFQGELAALCVANGMSEAVQTATLGGLCVLLRERFITLGKTETQLELVYRYRDRTSSPSSSDGEQPGMGAARTQTAAKGSVVETELALAVELSLDNGDAAADQADVFSQPTSLPTRPDDNDARATSSSHRRRPRRKRKKSPDHHQAGTVIGVDVFNYDGPALDDFLTDMARLWSGEREARGVEMDEVNKC